MKRDRLLPLILIFGAPIAVFLQSTLLANSLPGGSTPHLGFLLTVGAGYLWGGAAGTVSGLWVGVWLGAAAGSLAAPLACLYGFLGWLSGLHSDKNPQGWTYLLVTACLALTMVSGESWISLALDGYHTSLGWKLWTILWCTVLGSPLAILRRRGQDSAWS